MSTEHNTSILLVDDDPDNLLLLADELEELGADIITAESGQEAIDLAGRQRFSVVLMDLRMPRMSGVDAAVQINKTELNKKTPIIFITGMRDDKSILSGYQAGAVDYISKSESPEIIRSKVRVFLELDRNKRDLESALGKLELTSRNLRHHRDHLQEMVEQRTEELMNAKKSAEAASKAKSDFLSNMSHELRTPMNGILGMTQLIGTSNLDGTQREQLDIIDSSTQILMDIISEILEVSQLESGAVTIHEDPICLGSLIHQLFAVTKASTTFGEVDVQLQTHGDMPEYVRGDATRIRQILLAFLDNAVRFTEQGSIDISITATPAGEALTRLSFGVRDTGPGIPADNLPYLFEKFTQLDESTQRKHGGIGLGLAKAREVANLIGGEVEAVSQPGVGSTFTLTLTLPICDAPIPKAPEPARPTADGSSAKKRILLAEDNLVNQKVATKMLEKLGCEVSVAENGDQAVEMFREGQFDLIFMDCHMPIMDGYAATRAIRLVEADLSTHIPIFALTADITTGTKDECLSAGMDDYLTKPVKMDVLKEALERPMLADTPPA